MVIEPLFDDLHTITRTEQPCDGSSSSSQQQLTAYNYSLSGSQFFPQPTHNESNAEISDLVTIPGMYNVTSNLGQNKLQFSAGVSPDYHQRIRSNNALHNISQMLMEDVHERVGLHEGEAALHAAEKAFYDILEQVYPPSWPPLCTNNESDGPDESRNNYQKRPRRTSSTSDVSSHSMLHPLPAPVSPYNYGRSLFMPYQPSTSTGRAARFGFPAFQIIRSAEDAKGFDKLVIYLDSGKLSICRLTTKAKVVEKSKYAVFQITDHRGSKYPYIQDLNAREGSSSKQHTNTITCEISENRKFDTVLLCYRLDCFNDTISLRESMAKQARIHRKVKAKELLNRSCGARGRSAKKWSISGLSSSTVHKL